MKNYKYIHLAKIKDIVFPYKLMDIFHCFPFSRTFDILYLLVHKRIEKQRFLMLSFVLLYE